MVLRQESMLLIEVACPLQLEEVAHGKVFASILSVQGWVRGEKTNITIIAFLTRAGANIFHFNSIRG